MAERKTESQNTLPTGVELIADLGGGIIVAKVDIALIREQDKNARLMKPEMFKQLSENIKKRGGLESLPYCVLTDKIEVVSGHHRLRAAKEAGLKSIYVLLDVSGLNRSQIAAKQIAHNSLNGFDDNSVLKEIAKLITEVDDMIESYIGKEILGEPLAELDKLISPLLNFEWKQIEFVFLPHQLEKLEKLISLTSTNLAYVGAGKIEQYEQLIDALQKYQSFKNIKNASAAIYAMVEHAVSQMDEAGYKEDSEPWVPFTKIFGAGAIPGETALTIAKAINKMKADGLLNDGNKHHAVLLMAESYLNGSEKKKGKS